MKVCGEPLGLDLDSAAQAIVDIADETMVGALRLLSIERGHDPREFCLVAFGGAGPLHAASLAERLNIPIVLVPPNPGVASAWGLLMSDIKHDVRATRLLPVSDEQIESIGQAFADLESRLLLQLAMEKVPQTDFQIERYAEARYVGQSSTLRIVRSMRSSREGFCDDIRHEFAAEHEREFGYSVPSEPVELVTLGLRATARRSAVVRSNSVERADRKMRPKAQRSVFYAELGERVAVPVYERGDLGRGQVVVGPAIIEEFDSTTVLPPSSSAEVMASGVLRLLCHDRPAPQMPAQPAKRGEETLL